MRKDAVGTRVSCSFLERKEFGQKHSRLEHERVARAQYSLFFPIFKSASSSAGRADLKIKRTFLWGVGQGFVRDLYQYSLREFGIL